MVSRPTASSPYTGDGDGLSSCLGQGTRLIGSALGCDTTYALAEFVTRLTFHQDLDSSDFTIQHELTVKLIDEALSWHLESGRLIFVGK